MINLLPPKDKADYSYAQRNVSLLHWIIAFAIAMVGLLAIGTAGLVYMQQLSDNYQNQISTKQQVLKQQNLEETKEKAKDISSSLKLAVTVLSKEILFSELLEQLATVTPQNVVLASLNIGETSGSLQLTARATNYNAATQLQVNLADPANKIFAGADIINISCTETGEENSEYPCSVTIQAVFAKDNPFLFINQGKDQ